ncbi:hypothetical protein BH20CHL4_BH20CHL4_12010 [soil metagenome]
MPELQTIPKPEPEGDSSLPRVLTSLVGREDEVAELDRLLAQPSTRLVTILGPGGIGKTRLAMGAAHRALPRFADGARFVEFGSLQGPHLVLDALLRTLVPSASEVDADEAQLFSALRDRNQLLVLDCWDRVIEAAPVVARLLTSSPQITVLATSRERLRLAGEYEFHLVPLQLPASGAAVGPQDALGSPAVQLFVERVQLVDPDLMVTDDNAAVLAAICQRLEGLPLAIELAASRCAHVSPSSLLPLLATRLPLLVGGPRESPARHRTMRDAIGWSAELLTPEEQAAFRRLGVIAGPFSLAVATTVLGESDEDAPAGALTMLSSLIDKSLLQRADSLDGVPYFSMLDTIREYAAEQLREVGEEADAYRAYTGHIRRLADALAATPGGSLEESVAVLRLEAEIAGVRTALSRVPREANIDDLLSLLVSLSRYWRIASRQSEGLNWYASVLPDTGERITSDAARALEAYGYLLRDMGDYRAALPVFERSLHAYEQLSDPTGISRAHNCVGAITLDLGDRDRGRYHNQTALAIQELHDDRWGIARSRHNLGWIAILDGLPERARQLFEQSVSLWESEMDLDSEARAINSLGALASMQEAYPRAIEHYTRCTAMLRKIGAGSLLAESLTVLAAAQLGDGQIPAAARTLRESLAIYQRIGSRFRFAEAIETGAALALAANRNALAQRWLQSSAAIRQHTGIPPLVTWADRLAGWQTVASRVVATRFDRSATLPDSNEQLLSEVMALTEELAARGDSVTYTQSVLSRREREIIQLVATGMSDQAIANTLFISRKTASHHVSSILMKLDVSSRAAAAAIAVRDGLV